MSSPVKITFLGGLGDIGRNCAAIETEDSILLLDCGQLFPDESMPGADTVLPDFSYLEGRGHKIIGCIVTHGHEDHVGALSYLLRQYEFPLYGSAFTMGMAKHRTDEAGVTGRTSFNVVDDNSTHQIGPFSAEFLPVTHSVPMGLITAITTPQGVVMHSSDFKLDMNPVDGRRTDLGRIGGIGSDPGVRLFLCDSTNADTPGRSDSESAIGPVLRRVFEEQEGRRVITASFSSHIHRVQQIVEAALDSGRMIATLGMSMKRNMTLARQHGLLRIPDSRIVDLEDAGDIAPGELCVVSTGSQGESRSALARASVGDSRWIQITPDDTIVFSSHPIPGNEAGVGRMINELVKRGARVLTTNHLNLHTSGHGKKDELQILHSAVKPEWFVPVHGEYHHLVAHARLAEEMGMPPERVHVAADGDQLLLTDKGITLNQKVTPGAYTFVQGGLTEERHDVFSERLVLGDEGVVIALATVDLAKGVILTDPEVISRGWVGDDHYDEVHDEASAELEKALEAALKEKDADLDVLTRRARRAVGSFVNARTGRRPMIVPIITPIGGLD